MRTLASGIVLTFALVDVAAAAETLHSFPDVTPVDPAVNRFVSGAGDVDADGHADFAMAGAAAGVVSVHSGRTGEVLFDVFAFDVFQATRAYTFAAAGDVNADGHGDVVVGFGPGEGGGGGVVVDGPGTVEVFSGKDGAVLHHFEGETEHYYGYALAGAGDVDQDGHDDVVIGAPYGESSHYPGYAVGAVEVRSGNTGAILWSFFGSTESEQLGTAVAAAGDLDGDGFDDVLAANALDHGTVFAWSGATGAPLATFTVGPTAPPLPVEKGSGGYYLRALSLAGGADVDGDGTPDVAVGAFRDDTVRVFSGETGATLIDVQGAPQSRLGWTIDLGELNGDGHADVVAGRRSQTAVDDVVVVSGQTGAVVIGGVSAIADLSEVAIAGDVDGDGFADLAVRTDPWKTGGTLAVLAGGPWLGAAAGSDVQTGADVLTVNGSAGGASRRVDVDVQAPLSIRLDPSPAAPAPALFVVFGRLGAPSDADAYVLPGVAGPLQLWPAPLDPASYPTLFTLTSTHPLPGGALVPAAPGAPWVFDVPAGVPFPMTFTLEAIVDDGARTLAATNAVLVRVK